MKPEARTFTFEVRTVGDTFVSGQIRNGDTVRECLLPRFMCPPIACISEGAFYLSTQGVDPEKEEVELKRLLDPDINGEPSLERAKTDDQGIRYDLGMY